LAAQVHRCSGELASHKNIAIAVKRDCFSILIVRLPKVLAAKTDARAAELGQIAACLALRSIGRRESPPQRPVAKINVSKVVASDIAIPPGVCRHGGGELISGVAELFRPNIGQVSVKLGEEDVIPCYRGLEGVVATKVKGPAKMTRQKNVAVSVESNSFGEFVLAVSEATAVQMVAARAEFREENVKASR